MQIMYRHKETGHERFPVPWKHVPYIYMYIFFYENKDVSQLYPKNRAQESQNNRRGILLTFQLEKEWWIGFCL